MPKDISIEAYITQLVKLQQSSQKITPEFLKEIALECGVSLTEWNQLQQEAQNHYLNGESHYKYQNHKEAIASFEKCLQINPFDPGSLLGMAKTYQQLYQIRNTKINKTLSINYAQKLLEISPGHDAASQIIAQLSQKILRTYNYVLIFTIAVVLVAGMTLLSINLIQNKPQNQAITLQNQATTKADPEQQKLYNELIQKKEEVASKWAQVLNVTQRRNDLLDKTIGLIKSSQHFEEEMIDKLLSAKENVKPVANIEDQNSLKDYFQKQKIFDQQLNKFLEALQNPAFNSEKMYQDLQFQLERSENRIAIERKRYNEAIRDYNIKIQQIPYKQLNFRALPYFENLQ